MKRPFILSIILVLVVVGSVNAQNWQQTNGPSGAQIRAIAFDKKNDIFVLGDQLFKSTDNGLSWKQIAYAITNGKIGDIVVSPNGDIYISGGFYRNGFEPVSGIWRSTDLGETWSTVILDDQKNGYLSYILTTPDSSIHFFKQKTADFATAFRSADNGITWDSSTFAMSGYILESGADVVGNLFLCTTKALFRSTNKGKSWSKMVNGLPESGYRNIAFSPNGDVYVCLDWSNGYGLYKSSNHGRTWKRIIVGKDGYADRCAANGKGRILLTGGRGHGVFSFTDDSIWHPYTTVTNDLFPYDFDGGMDIESVFVGDNNNSFYMVHKGRIFRSSDSNGVWQQMPLPSGTVNAIASTADGTIITSNLWLPSQYYTTGIWNSTDNGSTWKQDHQFNVISSDSSFVNGQWVYQFDTVETSWNLAPNCFAIDSIHNIIAGNQGYTYRSTNSGSTWQLNPVKLTSGILSSVVVAPNDNIYTCSNTDGIYRSTDNGLTWDQLNDGILNTNLSALAVGLNNEVFASGSGGVYKSTDNALTWSLLTVDTFKSQVNCLVMSLQGKLIAGMNGVGMYESGDNGTTWSPLGSGLPTKIFNALLVTPSGIIFLATDSGVFQLGVGATSWTPYGIGLTTKNVLSLTRDKSGQLFAGTDGCGVFKSLQTFNIIQPQSVRSDMKIEGLTFIAPYPNPSRANLKYGFKNTKPIHLRIDCIDLTGKVLSQISDADFEAGEHSFSLDAADLSAGYYLLRFSCDGVSETYPFVRN